MLKVALNALTRIHSRPATLKRLGTPDIYSPCRITPSNYFRNLRGPEYTTIKGVEFIIPVDSLLGQHTQTLVFSAVPDAGQFKITVGADTTAFIAYNASAATIQTALRLLTPLANILVTGNFTDGFLLTFVGFSATTTLGDVTSSTLTESGDAVTDTWTRGNTPWDTLVKKGDRITDGSRTWAIDESIEMHDLGAQVMAFRARAD